MTLNRASCSGLIAGLTQALAPTPPYRVLMPSCGHKGNSKGSIGQTFPGMVRPSTLGRGLVLSNSQLDHIKADAWAGKFLWFGWYIFS